MISRLHYITQDIPTVSHAQLAKEACEAGIKWIQLRVKEKNNNEYLAIADEVKKICDAYAVKLIVNDNAFVAKEINAHGVHLGKTDMPVADARKIFNSNFIVGATANTFDDIKKLSLEKVDYIGLGPFKFTTTKKNLSPVLGIEGYEKIIEQCKLNNIHIPIIAIGGITGKDIAAIMNTGVYGIALSSYISISKNKKECIGDILYKLHNTLITALL